MPDRLRRGGGFWSTTVENAWSFVGRWLTLSPPPLTCPTPDIWNRTYPGHRRASFACPQPFSANSSHGPAREFGTAAVVS